MQESGVCFERIHRIGFPALAGRLQMRVADGVFGRVVIKAAGWAAQEFFGVCRLLAQKIRTMDFVRIFYFVRATILNGRGSCLAVSLPHN